MNEILRSMFDCFSKGDQIYLPSKFWEFYNDKNIKQIEIEGIENIKQTVARNYFTWLIGIKDNQFHYLLRNTQILSWPSIIFGPPAYVSCMNLSWTQRVELAIFTRMLWRNVERIDVEGLLNLISEPRQGNPFEILLDGKLISQDLANSVLEYYSIREHFKGSKTEKITFCELGAGYGRNAHVFLSVFPRGKYIVIDIPPALYVSQEYLSSVYPDKKVFGFRCFDLFEEIEQEFCDADIVFLLPHQAAILPEKSVDLFINISSLHEMQMSQIKEYFNLIDKLTKGYFYSKQWLVSENPIDEIVITKNDYPVPRNWQELYSRRAKVQEQFFEAMYRITSNGMT
jgi:putative sugar O-methyltransferase